MNIAVFLRVGQWLLSGTCLISVLGCGGGGTDVAQATAAEDRSVHALGTTVQTVVARNRVAYALHLASDSPGTITVTEVFAVSGRSVAYGSVFADRALSAQSITYDLSTFEELDAWSGGTGEVKVNIQGDSSKASAKGTVVMTGRYGTPKTVVVDLRWADGVDLSRPDLKQITHSPTGGAVSFISNALTVNKTVTGSLVVDGVEVLAEGPGLYGQVATGDTIEIVRSR